jgi:hypoxanthine phosphoribosyltransferase
VPPTPSALPPTDARLEGLDHGPIVFDQEQIRVCVARLAAQISADYFGSDLVVVGVLPGVVFFLSDLVRSLAVPVELDLMAITRFGPPEVTGREVRIQRDIEVDVKGRPVLLVEDIVDTGLTVHHLMGALVPRQPESIRVAALLERPNRRLIRVPLTYVGLRAPEDFLVGYGLQHQGRYRQLPYIAQLPPGEQGSSG